MPTVHVTVPSREDRALVLFKALGLCLARWGRCEETVMDLMSLTGLFYHVDRLFCLQWKARLERALAAARFPPFFSWVR